MDDRPEVFHHFVTTVVALLILEQHSRYPEAHFLVVLSAIPGGWRLVGLFSVD